MALTKIFTGMEKGPEKIDANFKELNNSTIKDTGWRRVSLKNATGTVYIRRIGQNVSVSGMFRPTSFATLKNALDLFLIPAGFRPDTSRFKFYNAVSGGLSAPLRTQIKKDGSGLIMIFSPEKADVVDWSTNFSWTTNDDFPN